LLGNTDSEADNLVQVGSQNVVALFPFLVTFESKLCESDSSKQQSISGERVRGVELRLRLQNIILGYCLWYLPGLIRLRTVSERSQNGLRTVSEQDTI